MSRMDFDQPYGTVYDMPGVRYQQQQKYYRQNGEQVEMEPVEPTREPEAPTQTVTNNSMTADDLRRPENKALKAQLEVYGGTWTNRKAAIEFLQGRA